MSAAYSAMRAYQRARLAAVRLRGARNWDGVRILGYHRLASGDETLSVPPAAFRAQLEAVLESGAVPLRLAEAAERLRRPVRGRYFCVTFDDGYLDNVSDGEQVLADLGVTATIFLPTRMIDGDLGYDWYADPPPSLSWEEIAETRTRGVFDFQAHSRSHAWLTSVDADRAWREIAGSKADIEARLGIPVTSFAFPAGMYRRRHVALVERAGYRAAVTSQPGVNPGGRSLFALRRTFIYREDTPDVFAAKLGGLLDRRSLVRSAAYRVAAVNARRHPERVPSLPRRV